MRAVVTAGGDQRSGTGGRRVRRVLRREPRWARLARSAGQQERPLRPARIVATAFALAIAVCTALLVLPASHAAGQGTSLRVALFTATSAVCVTGLAVTDTATHWSPFGQAVILVGIQVGGVGIMTLASLLGLLVQRRLGLRSRLLAQAENPTVRLGDARRVVLGVLTLSLGIEAAVTVLLTARFAVGYGEGFGTALWHGGFTAVSAFNNAGFALQPGGLVGFVGDWWICLPVCAAIALGALGFPVLVELGATRRRWRPGGGASRRWSLHTKLTLAVSGILLLVGTALVTTFEWRNPGTLGPLAWPDKLLAGLFQGVQPRTAGFNTVDYGAMRPETWLVTDVLMFIGGGSASTAGGIKVTTFAVLVLAMAAEARGGTDVQAFRRRIPDQVVRVSVGVALLATAWVGAGTLVLMELTGLSLDRAVFEAVSAFATVGLSTGVTGTLPASADAVLVVLMFVGRVGTVTAASALLLRDSRQRYSFPEERPIVG
ncbi:MAG: TrkH family potassium uptake protein [Motilibacteraceae bacterium]